MKSVERVSKLDVARRQLRQAILLFFERRDPIAVHSLTAAAHGILRDLGRSRGVGSFLKDNPYVLPEKRDEVVRLLNEAQNFLKHADRDPAQVYDFHAAATRFYILDAVEMWGGLTGCFFKEALCFRLWFLVAYPHLVKQQEVQVVLEPFRRQLGAGVNDFDAILGVIGHASDDPDVDARLEVSEDRP